jgi:hypothetical protein
MMRSYFIIILTLSNLCIFMTALEKPAAADTHNVSPGQSIQAAINSAVNGDQIEVAQGTYYEAIDFKGKAVRLYSSGGPSSTRINGTGYYHVVKCVSGEGPSTIIEVFIITGGNAIGASYPDNCGGGMFNDKSSPTVTNCTFGGNSANTSGGGMFNYNSSPTVINCTFLYNSAVLRGGGMYNYGSPSVNDCIFGNNSSDSGGGMYNYNSANMTNCAFINNTAVSRGGGMFNYQGSQTVTNCTFSGNSANISGGGIYIYGNSVVTNCIIWGNTPNEINYFSRSPTVTYSDIQGGWGGTGNINADPCFVDAAADNLRLKPDSPCIDAANGAALLPLPWSAFDLDGNARYFDFVFIPDTGASPGKFLDMGAYELQCNWSIGDINCDGTVDLEDLAILANHWLEGTTP